MCRLTGRLMLTAWMISCTDKGNQLIHEKSRELKAYIIGEDLSGKIIKN